MFLLNGKPLPLDTPFTVGEGDSAVHYPANFLRLSTSLEKADIGITEHPDPAVYDSRYYWGVGVPKDFAQVKSMFEQRMKDTAYSLLSPTDYKLVRKVETGEAVDQTTLDKRVAIRTAYTDNMELIEAATTVDQLAALQFTWPESNA